MFAYLNYYLYGTSNVDLCTEFMRFGEIFYNWKVIWLDDISPDVVAIKNKISAVEWGITALKMVCEAHKYCLF